MARGIFLKAREQVARCVTDSWCRSLIALLCAFFLQIGVSSASNLPVIVAGAHHSCALSSLSGGTVSCWGSNSLGQLGDGTTTDRFVPTEVPGLSGVTALAAGGNHTCALIAATGGVKCWGGNNAGQLGDSTTTASPIPVDVVDGPSSPIVGVAEITAGFEHSCARFTTGGLVCWGANVSGQLGNTTLIDSWVATAVSGASSDVSQVSAGFAHTCFVRTSTKEVLCFGENVFGALGNNSTIFSSTPVLVSGITTAVEVSAGDRFTCARLSNGSVQCWGGNDSGSLGNGTTTNSTVPVSVGSSPLDASIIDAGGGNGDTEKFACAVLATNGQVQCWGTGTSGVLGNGAESQQTLPVDVTGLTQVVALSSGSYHSCAWIGTCTIKCWGYGFQGRLGTGDAGNQTTPVEIRTCEAPTPTPTPAITSTPDTGPGQAAPDACRSEKSCVPDASLTTPLDPTAPEFDTTPVPKGSSVLLSVAPIKLGVPVDLTQRAKLKTRLEKVLGKKVTNLATAIRSLQIFYVFSVVRAKTTSGSDIELAALPRKFRAETRNRRVTARLGPGTYVATVTARVKAPNGKVFSTSKRSESVTFTVK